MNLEIYKTEHESLEEYIDYYYVLERTDSSFEESYLTFPSSNSIISIMEKTNIERLTNEINVEYNAEKPLKSLLVKSFNAPILIRYKGVIKEISICFKPLGIHVFINNPKKTFTENDPFLSHPDFKEKMTEILHVTDNIEMIRQVENYLLSKRSTFSHPFLHRYINDISNDSDLSISELSTKYGVSQKTFIKHCKTYLNRTPSAFKKVVRFQKAMNNYFDSANCIQSFTNISHAVNFFDQAHMIKDFKSFTGYTPSNFFKKLNPIDGEIKWIFLKG